MVVGGSNTGVVQLTQKAVFLIYWQVQTVVFLVLKSRQTTVNRH
jgi:hypothetical protein